MARLLTNRRREPINHDYSSQRGRGLPVEVGRRRTWRFSSRLVSAGEGGRFAEPCFVFSFPLIYLVCLDSARLQHGDEEEDQSGDEEQKPRGGV